MATLLRSLIPFLILAGLSAAQVRDPLPVPDIPGYKTLKCDFHMHTVFSDGEVWPTTRVMEAWRDGLDAIALTDHANYNPHKEDVKDDLLRPHALAAARAAQLGIILIPGVEINQDIIHYNVLFAADPHALRGLELREALRRAKAQGAFSFWDHPGWRRPKAEWLPLVAGLHEEKLFDGMELVNGTTFYPEAYPWVAEKNLTILANSDIHAPIAREYEERTRPLTLVFARSADAAGIREALFARRTAAWQGGQVWGAEPHLKALWEGAVKLENPEIRRRPGQTSAALLLRNTSAIAFRVRVREAPPWLRISGGEVRPESVTGLVATFAKGAPSAGPEAIQVQLEITNLHTGPSRNLTAPLRLRIGASQ